MFQKLLLNLEMGQMFPAVLQGARVKGVGGTRWEAGEALGARGGPSWELDNLSLSAVAL